MVVGRFADAKALFRQALDSGSLGDTSAADAGYAMATAPEGPSAESVESLRAIAADIRTNLGTRWISAICLRSVATSMKPRR